MSDLLASVVHATEALRHPRGDIFADPLLHLIWRCRLIAEAEH
jgi:hypothetical protein